MSEVTGNGSLGRDWNFLDYSGNMFTAMGKSGYNAVASFDNLFYSGVQAISFDYIETPRFELYKPSNPDQAASMLGTDLGILAISAYSGGSTLASTRSASYAGFSTTPKGNSFAQKLFHSKTFGKESRLFGNSTFDMTGSGRQGLLNQTGSPIKIGWSKDRRLPLSLTSTEYGSAFRIGRGVGSRSNIANKHYYFPNTYLPESYTNQFIFRATKK